MQKRLVIYHAGCADGFCAAWLLRKVFPDAEFLPANYGDQPPDVSGKIVYMVDFSYPRETLLKMEQQAEMITVLDHHKTAQRELQGLPFCKFDMTKSGGRMTFEYIRDTVIGWKITAIPWIVRYTEDRDLWLWQLCGSREINACLRSYPMEFDVWNQLCGSTDIEPPEWMVVAGEAILRDQQRTVEAKVSQAGIHLVSLERGVETAGALGWNTCNATTLISETAGELAKAAPIGCCWFEMDDGSRVYSLRTRNEAIDVSWIARMFGGGGHAKAAGFKLAPGKPHPWNDELWSIS